jgi:hypothetical protein
VNARASQATPADGVEQSVEERFEPHMDVRNATARGSDVTGSIFAMTPPWLSAVAEPSGPRLTDAAGFHASPPSCGGADLSV